MLYVTTRNDRDAFTVPHVIAQSRDSDEGLFLPFRFPKLSAGDLKKLYEQSLNQRIASILNLFFATKLSGWDVDFSVGRFPVRIKEVTQRIALGEFWHNLQWKYRYLENKLAELVGCVNTEPGSWSSVAIRMAILAATLMECHVVTTDRVDVAVAASDFTVPIGAWYLRKMGFPIGNIICSCAENSQLWDLICLGQMRTDSPVPVDLERLIYDCGGVDEVTRYLSCCADGVIYHVSDEVRNNFQQGLFVSVVSDDRLETSIPNVYKTYNRILQSESAQAYCGLMDYRAKTGITRAAVIICDDSPAFEAEKISERMNLTTEAFLKLI